MIHPITALAGYRCEHDTPVRQVAHFLVRSLPDFDGLNRVCSHETVSEASSGFRETFSEVCREEVAPSEEDFLDLGIWIFTGCICQGEIDSFALSPSEPAW